MNSSILGDVLYIDLTNKKISKSPYTKELASQYIGSRGYNVALLWEMVAKGIDPLSPENVLIFGAGPLTGTSAPSSGRISVTAKSPATNLYLKTNVGGAWGGEIRYAGYSFIVITGKADRPVYLWINDGKVEIRDAQHLWGKDVRETEHILQNEIGDGNIKVASIGPAGENLVLFAAIMCSNYNAAARGGIGAVMGSKNMKALAVRGTQPVSVAEPERFKDLIDFAWDLYHKQSGALDTHLYGTSVSVSAINEMNSFPTYNYQIGHFEHADKITGQALVEGGYLKHRVGCYACPMACHRYSEVNRGKYKGAYTGGPEYETFGSLGAGCGIGDIEAIIHANELCNIYGLDTISTGSVIQWAMECHQRKLNFDRDGLDFSWGNADTVISLIKKIAYQEGLGRMLANGVKRASEEMGQNSEEWAIQAKGLEQSRVETRSAYSYALAFMVNPRGPDHLMTETLAEFGTSPEMVDVIEKITGDKKYATPLTTEKRPEIVRWHEDVYAITDGLGLCAFASTAQYYMTPQLMADLFSASVGIPCSEEQCMKLGKKIVTMERCFNTREGATRKDDRLPKRLMTEKLKDSPNRLNINSMEIMSPLLDRYYEMHGWDIATGRPTRSVLEEYGLKAWADELNKHNYLP
ncbi:MAG: aldehyde ferredoxin oxidoreductase family protein [Anaerolineales bacterium]|nr:aldehyde ferredoxin oxidoreductase family protein [Anaerolineales bacterium]